MSATDMGDNMKKYFTTGFLAVVALASTLGSAGCCCQRKGIVLRGDWSFELNRVPHMRSNGPTYSGDACTMSCDEYSCTSCDDGSCVGCRSGGQAGGRSGGGYYESVPGGAGSSGGYESGAPMPAPPQPTPAAQSRFHPVPTRPVFEPQHSMADARYEAGGYEAPINAGGGASSRRAAEGRQAAPRSTEPSAVPRGNRVASYQPAPPLPRREAEPALFEAGEDAGELAHRGGDEVIAAAEMPAEEPVVVHATSDTATSEGAWRVKARRS